MGENGAGKSTLMKILGGVYQADGGTISIDGTVRNIRNVQDSAACGISVIYQEFNLVPELTVAENIYISDVPKKTFLGIVEKKKRRSEERRVGKECRNRKTDRNEIKEERDITCRMRERLEKY